MKPRLAAAFSLGLLAACAGPSVKAAQSTGWRIMRPPQINGQLDETAPLSKWIVHPADIDVYPSQKQCEQMIENWREGSQREDFREAAKRDETLRCVATNDPRLKSK
jgi:hypothetical protein